MTPELRQLAWTAGLTAGGLLLLYLLRPRRRRVEVPFGGLWQRVLQESQGATAGRHWRRWLSLLLMLGIAALLLGALGEPMWRGAQLAKVPVLPAPHVALIVDCSASMATRDGDGPLQADGLPPTRLAQALARTQSLIAMAPADAHFLLLTASGHAAVRLGWTQDRKALQEALASVTPTDGGLDLQRAHATAREALSGRSQPHAVLITDGGPPLASLPGEATPVLSLLAVGPKAAPTAQKNPLMVEDLAVLEVRVRADAGDPDRGTLTVQVRNASAQPVPARLLVASSSLARTALDFAAEENLRRVVEVDLPPGLSSHAIPGLELAAPRFAVRVRTRDPAFRDRAAFDDVGYAVLAQRRELHVLLVDDSDPDTAGAQPNLFLSGALHAIDRVRVQEMAPADYQPQAFALADRARHGIDLVVMNQVRAPLPEGTPGLALRLQPPEGEDKQVFLHAPEIVVRAGDHATMAGVSFQDTNFDTVRVIKPGPGDIVLAAARPNGAVLLAHQGATRWLEWGVDLSETDLAARYALPLLIVNALTWLAGEAQPLVTPLELGRPWAIEVPEVGVPWTWLEPGQPPRPARMSADQLLASSEIQGIHLWTAGDGKEVARPTALPATEDPAATGAALSTWHDLPRPPPVDPAGRWPTWLLLLAGALALLAAEWWAYLRRRTV